MARAPRYAEEPIGDLLPPTSKGILDWACNTRPPPPRDVVVEHIRWLASENVIAEPDLARLAIAGYRV